MSQYREPGVDVYNQFQAIANPNTGSTIITDIVGALPTQLEAYPSIVTDALRSSAVSGVTSATFVDTFSIAQVTPGLFDSGVLSTATRISSIQYSGRSYTSLKTMDKTTTAGSLALVNFTAAGSGAPDTAIPTTLDGSSGTPLMLPLINGAAYTVATIIDAAGNVYLEGADFTKTVNVASPAVTVDITWTGNYPASVACFFAIGMFTAADSTTFANILSSNVYTAVVVDTTNNVVDYKLIWKGESTAVSAGTLVQTTPPPQGATFSVLTKKEFPASFKIYTSLAELSSDWGPVLLQDGTRNNLAFAAYLAFSEGAVYLAITGYDGIARSGQMHRTMVEAFDDILQEDQIHIVTVLDNVSPVTSPQGPIAALFNHIKAANAVATKKWRLGIVGVDLSASNDDAGDYKAIAQLLYNQNMMVIGPSQAKFALNVASQPTVTQYTVGAEYLAVVAAAMWGRSESDVATSLTRKQSRTILDLVTKYSDAKMNLIASYGVTLFSKLRGQFVVRDDITTYTATLLESQPYVTLTSHDIARGILETLDTSVIGMKLLVPATLEIVKGLISSMLLIKQRDGIIQNFGTPIVSVDPVNPLKILVTVPVVPMLAVKQIDVTVSYTIRG